MEPPSSGQSSIICQKLPVKNYQCSIISHLSSALTTFPRTTLYHHTPSQPLPHSTHHPLSAPSYNILLKHPLIAPTHNTISTNTPSPQAFVDNEDDHCKHWYFLSGMQRHLHSGGISSGGGQDEGKYCSTDFYTAFYQSSLSTPSRHALDAEHPNTLSTHPFKPISQSPNTLFHHTFNKFPPNLPS